MVDNVAITAGSGTDVATDDEGGVHFQKVKLTDGATGSTTPIEGNADGLFVVPHATMSRIQVASTGLTTATTAYITGDQMGAIMEFPNAVTSTGGSAIIQSATLLDKAGVTGATDVYLFDQTVTVASDNAAASFSDADMANCLGMLTLATPVANAVNSLTTLEASGLAVSADATSVFAAIVTQSGHTYFGAATDLVLTLTFQQQ